MAIQIRRGTDAEWESNKSNIVAGEPAIAMDTERVFVGTGTGTYVELANIDFVEKAMKEVEYSNFELQSVKGDIVSFPNGAGGIPVKDLQVSIEAVQDLHGYDNPWVGGAGKNLFNENAVLLGKNYNGSNASARAVLIFQPTQGTYTFSINSIGTLAECAVGHSKSAYPISDLTHVESGALNNTKKSRTYTTDSEYSYLYMFFRVASGSITLADIQSIKMQIELGTTATAYEPYENICPISGWSAVNVMRTGKNLFDISTFSANDCMYQYDSSFTHGIGQGTLTKNEDSFTLVRVNTSYAYFICVGECFANIPVTISFNVTEGYVFDIDARTEPPSQTPNNDKRFYRDTTVGGLSSVVRTFTPAQDGYVYIEIYSTSGNLTNTVANLQYEFGSIKTDYERGSKQTYTTDLDGTRYGGTLDVTTGVLTVTHELIDLGTIGWNTGTVGTNITIFYSNAISDRKSGSGDLVCSNYKTIAGSRSNLAANDFSIVDYNGGNQRVAIRDSNYDNATTTEFKTAMNGVQLVYELATPQVVQLTPTEVTTLLGQNNIWCDTGAIEELTYRISNVQ